MRRTSPGRMSVRLDRAVLIWFATFAVGLLLGLLVGFLLGRIGGDREGAATPLPPARAVTIERPVPAPEKPVPAPAKSPSRRPRPRHGYGHATASP
jgi:hypothetical protein